MDNGASSYRRFRDNGDVHGLDEIIIEYSDGLILYLTSIVGNIQMAEELAEDTFVLLGTKKPKFREKSSFKTWLYTIGRNIAIDYLRKYSKKTCISLEETSEMIYDEISVEEDYFKKERQLTVDTEHVNNDVQQTSKKISGLPRILFRLRHYQIILMRIVIQQGHR